MQESDEEPVWERKVLDHGYVRLIAQMGSDRSIIEAARMSTGRGFEGWGPMCESCGSSAVPADLDGLMFVCRRCGSVKSKPGDEKLLRYLWENRHATPFEMGAVTIEVKAPIFVFREWHRHRTQSYNEMSARYMPLPDENYMPTVERLMQNSGGTNRQAGTAVGALPLTEEAAHRYREALSGVYEASEFMYQEALHQGVPKELARIHLPVGRYSRMRASANLRNWFGFLALRSTVKNPAAQWEIRQFADAVLECVEQCFPRATALFRENPLHREQRAFLLSIMSLDMPESVRDLIRTLL
jgi:thymidylate synthase (FAD)